MANLAYISSRVNQFKEQITNANEALANAFLLITIEAGGFLSLIDKQFPEDQAATLFMVKPGFYQKVNIVALRVTSDNQKLILGLAPTTERLTDDDLRMQQKSSPWPLWVPLEKGPVIKSVTVLELSKRIWQFVDNLIDQKK